MRRFLSLIDATNEWIGRIAWVLVVFVMVSMTIEVVSRYGFNHPTSWVWDVSKQLGAVFYMLGGAYALLHYAHVRVDVIYARFSPRRKAIIDLITSTLFFFFCIILVWKGWELAWASTLRREAENSILAPPLYPLRWLFVVAVFLMMLQGVVEFVRDLNTAITGKEAAERTTRKEIIQ